MSAAMVNIAIVVINIAEAISSTTDVDDSVIEVAAELLLSEGIGVALGVWAGDVAVGVR
jgi:hypothetical protein